MNALVGAMSGLYSSSEMCFVAYLMWVLPSLLVCPGFAELMDLSGGGGHPLPASPCTLREAAAGPCCRSSRPRRCPVLWCFF